MSLKLFDIINDRIMFDGVDVNLLSDFAKLFNIELFITIIKPRQIGPTNLAFAWNTVFFGTDVTDTDNAIRSDYIKQIKNHYRKQKSNDLYKHWSQFLKLKSFI